MIIQHNIPALNSHRNLGINNNATAKNLEKLSSGFRINRAGDDAAGLAISEKMRGQIRGLAMAEQNAANGISLIQTAEGGLNETHAILQRMRELAVQSSNGTYQDDDRKQIQLEVDALKSEINRIATSTHYNGINLLDGSLGNQVFNAAEVVGNAQGPGATMSLHAIFGAGVTASITATTVTGTDKLNGDFAIDINIYGELQVTSKSGSVASATNTNGDTTYTISYDDGDNTATIEFKLAKNDIDAIKTAIEGGHRADVGNAGASYTFTIGEDSGNERFDTYIQTEKTWEFEAGDGLILQIGANGTADQRVTTYVDNMSTFNMGLKDANGDFELRISDVDLSDRDDANAAIKAIDAAINQVSSQRASLGAMQNRLEHTLNNLGVTKENLTAAESTIRDVDMAKEMMEFTKNNILVQASQAMLAQANALPQGVLSLLR